MLSDFSYIFFEFSESKNKIFKTQDVFSFIACLTTKGKHSNFVSLENFVQYKDYNNIAVLPKDALIRMAKHFPIFAA